MDKSSLYSGKNLTVYVIAAILQFYAANATMNLVTSLGGEDKGFAMLVVIYIARYSSIKMPAGLVMSLGCKKSIIIVNIVTCSIALEISGQSIMHCCQLGCLEVTACSSVGYQ